MPTPVIVARGVSKRFVLDATRATSLKEKLVRSRTGGREELWAVRDLDLEVDAGVTLGIIGANGSGKSTTLKLLAGILRPTSGTVEVQGRVASLLELGAGFHGDLSGRDNVFLNGALLGLSRREIAAKLDDIIAFAELEQFIDSQVKHYSTGMYVRLGFAVAVHVDPDILLVDEVLAVGDEAFQRKCLDRIAQFQAEGRTILVVTHALDLVEQVCSQALVLHHGEARYFGDPGFATGTLRRILGVGLPPAEKPPEHGVRFESAVYSARPGGPPKDEFAGGEPWSVRLQITVAEHAALPAGGRVELVAMGAGEIPIWVMGRTESAWLEAGPGSWTVDVTVPALPPLAGAFALAVSIVNPDGVPVAAHRVDDVFTVTSGQPVGLLAVPYSMTARRSS
jgi:ABC-2 type transport system ATP-binding protein